MGELELHEELGKGNYGTVKKVRHKPTNVLMAMKVNPCQRDLYSIIKFNTGDSIRTGQVKVECYNYGVGYSASSNMSSNR
jgi:hypothetical protein